MQRLRIDRFEAKVQGEGEVGLPQQDPRYVREHVRRVVGRKSSVPDLPGPVPAGRDRSRKDKNRDRCVRHRSRLLMRLSGTCFVSSGYICEIHKIDLKESFIEPPFLPYCLS